jgi:uncharacterized protein YbjQ (UPF0145 family)
MVTAPDHQPKPTEAPPGAQGWTLGEGGLFVWRTVVTTSERVAGFEIASHLGPCSGDVAVASAGDGLESRIGLARERATQLMVDHACAKGAHAVIRVDYQVTSIGLSTVVTATGTAVTLTPIS